MKQTLLTISLFLGVVLSLPLQARAFWGSDGENHATLNLGSGYDVNTVITVTGHFISPRAGNDRPNVQLEIETSGANFVICAGPQHYWKENGIPVSAGDSITVRGSKAQENDGTIYIIAQKIINTTQNLTVVLRDESGRPAWAGKGVRRNQGRRTTQPPRDNYPPNQ